MKEGRGTRSVSRPSFVSSVEVCAETQGDSPPALFFPFADSNRPSR